MVSESWFRNLWKTPKKRDSGSEKVFIGVLGFEVASLMSKLIHMWHSLSDKQVFRMREEITNSEGIKKIVSDNEEYVAGLICSEMLENLRHVAEAVARLGKKCCDPSLKTFESTLDDLLKIGIDPCGWEFAAKEMEKKAKKMERFISSSANLYREMETLGDLEQAFRRMKSSETDADKVSLLEFQKKVLWKRHEVKTLKQNSLWSRTYDYTVLLLARSLFTIFRRIKNVFGIQQMVDIADFGDLSVADSDFINRSQSVSALLQSSIHPYNNGLTKYSSGPVGNLMTTSNPRSYTDNPSIYYSGPLGGAATRQSPISHENRISNFHSGPIGRSTTKSGPISRNSKTKRGFWQGFHFPSAFPGKNPHSKNNRSTQVGPSKGGMMTGNGTPVRNSNLKSSGTHSGVLGSVKDAGELQARGSILHSKPAVLSLKQKFLDAPPGSLGAAALALHYANVIIIIEKFAASSHLIGHDARDDLYNMLPARVRSSLRAKLKPYAKTLDGSVYDSGLAGEWNESISGILEWLTPLAHNTIRWQSERSYEQHNLASRTDVLLVQTLHFANQEKTEARITELLVGLNYVWRCGRELNAKAMMECASSSRMFDECLELEE